ncbi:MAG: UDP-glucose 4-epimerase GalE [Acetobacterales bacterium]
MAESILVAGGAGYIGSHVCKALSMAGYLPVVYDSLVTGYPAAVQWGPLERGDLDDRERLHAVFDAHGCSAVVQLAGFISAGESVQNPAKYYRNNLRGMLTLLEVMRGAGVDRIVFSSSAAVYGTPRQVPIAENAPIEPMNPYGHTKAMSEQFLCDEARNGLRSVSLRYFNAAGADPDGELGEAHDPETHLIPLVLQAAAGIRPHVDVYGDAYPTDDGTCVRDYVHVADLAAAHVAALRRTEEVRGASAYNLGNGRGVSVREVIEMAECVTGRAIAARVCAPRPGDPPRLVADSTLARNELGWTQQYADLETQVAHAWSWFLRQPEFSTAASMTLPCRRAAS